MAMGLLVAASTVTLFNLSVVASHYYTRHVASIRVQQHAKRFNDCWKQEEATHADAIGEALNHKPETRNPKRRRYR